MAAEKNNGTFPATRQGSRVHLAIPVFVYGSHEEGDPFQEVTDTLSVNAGGGLIGMVTPVKKGQKLLLVNLKTEERIQCSVMNVHDDKGSCSSASPSINPRHAIGVLYFQKTGI